MTLCVLNPAADLIDADRLNAAFVVLLPRIELHARIRFRQVPCPQRRDDAVAETVALAWCWFVKLAGRGKDATQFVTRLADFAGRHVFNGRRLCGPERTSDVLSTMQRHQDERTAVQFYAEELPDERYSPVPDQVALKCDFPAWLNTLRGRDRRVAEELAAGRQTREVARQFDLSPARVHQLRQIFRRRWLRFTGEKTQTSLRFG
jgi:hypothetical protein